MSLDSEATGASADERKDPPRDLNIFANKYAWAGWLASVISVPLGVYFYFAGSSSPKVLLTTHSTASAVIRQSTVPGLEVSIGQRPVTGDVTAISAVLWNAGNRAVTSNMILEPVELVVDPAVRILQASIGETTRDVVRPSLRLDALSAGRVGIDWKILEKDDGFVVQLVYEGEGSARVHAVGVVEGQRDGVSTIVSDPRERKDRLARVLATMMGGVLTSLVAEAVRRLDRWFAKHLKHVDKTGQRLVFLLHATGLAMISYGVFLLYTIQAPPL